MAQDRLRIGFVGAGSMGQCAHLRNYVTLDGCEVVALAELRAKTGSEVARRYGIPRVYRDHQEMLASEKLDGIVASQPFNRHGVLLKDLAKAGLPIFIEKPLAASVEVGESILEALSAGGATLMVGYHKRSDPAVIRAREEIDRLKASGHAGAMTYVRCVMPMGNWIANGFTDLIDGGDPRPQLEADPPASDMDDETYRQYVSFVNYSIHPVNLMRHLLTEPYEITYADPSGKLLAGRSRSGIPCVIETGAFCTSRDWQESAFVAFERGYLKIELPAPLVINRPGRVEILAEGDEDAEPLLNVPQLPAVHAMRRQAMDFLDVIRSRSSPPTGAAEALEDLKLARRYFHLLKGV